MNVESIEDLARSIRELEPCMAESRHALTLVEGRLHLGRGPSDTTEFFIEGSRESFGLAAVGRSLEWGTFNDLGMAREFKALVVRAEDGETTLRLMAHLAYEAVCILVAKPETTNSELLERLTPFVDLVIQRRMLSVRQQSGLTGELLFLTELINFAEQHDPPIDLRTVLDAWKGWDSASRDFAGDGVAVEVKATGQDVRRHAIHPMYQLLPDPTRATEQVYVYSLGLRIDRSSAFTLLTAFDRVVVRLNTDTQRTLMERLEQYGGVGFNPALRSHYVLEPGFVVTHAPELFRVDQLADILRPEAFVGNAPPARALRIQYDVLLEGLAPLQSDARDVVLGKLLRLP